MTLKKQIIRGRTKINTYFSCRLSEIFESFIK